MAKVRRVPARALIENLPKSDPNLSDVGVLHTFSVSSDFSLTIINMGRDESETCDKVKFFTTPPLKAKTDEGNSEEQKLGSTDIRTSYKQSMLVDYPLVFYKSPCSDNSEIIAANFAHKEPNHLVLNLNEYSFLCFIGMPELSVFRMLQNNNPSLSRALMLVKSRNSGHIKIMMIEISAWFPLDSEHLHLQTYLICAKDIKIDPEMQFE